MSVNELRETPAPRTSHFSSRRCPACASRQRIPLFELKARQFCSANWTYAQNYNELLELNGDETFPIDRCGDCGFVYARLLPSEDFLKLVYEQVISFKECQGGSENAVGYARRMRYIATLLELCAKKEQPRALDFGCGLGVTLRLLRAVNATATGYDPSPIRTDSIKSPGIRVLAELDELDREEKFDILICDNVLEHVPEPSQTIKLLALRCNPGSVLFMSVPGYEDVFIESQLDAIEKAELTDMTLNPWEHLNYFNLLTLDRMLLNAGFEAIEASELPENVNIGLRPQQSRLRRFKNGLASAVRMIRYVSKGDTARSVEYSFYRFAGN